MPQPREIAVIQPIRIAVVGLGKIAQDKHLPAIEGDPRFVLAAVASPHGQHEVAPSFDSLEALLASGLAFDAVALCTPPQVRQALARTAIEAGKAVMLEKPPGATLSEVESLRVLAEARGVTLYAAWHSRFAPGVAPAQAWLRDRVVRAVTIAWKEDVRIWHPGQAWIWRAGGLGVFDPGINALSIATAILPRPFALVEATLHVPENLQAPCQAELRFRDTAGALIQADFDFLQTGPQSWDITVETDAGPLRMAEGGAALWIDGAPIDLPPQIEPQTEYAGVYDAFAGLIAAGQSEVDLAPMRHVADAFMLGERVLAPAFVE